MLIDNLSRNDLFVINTERPMSSADLKPGSSSSDAAKVGGDGDFGVAESNVTERTYTSMNTRRSDPGAAPAHSFDDGGDRTSGVGGNASGPGSSSGGDIDTDFVGLDGRGLSSSVAPDDNGPDDQAPASHLGHNPASTGESPDKIVGSTVQRGDDRSTAGLGADAASNEGEDNDAAAGEVSSAEATGADDAGV